MSQSLSGRFILTVVLYTDIDECVRDSIDCGLNGMCINTNGSYLCGCVAGFYRNGSDCCKLLIFFSQLDVIIK